MLWAARHTQTRLPHPTVAGTLTETLQQELTQHHRCSAAAVRPVPDAEGAIPHLQ